MGGMRNSYGRGSKAGSNGSRLPAFTIRQTARLKQVIVVACVVCLAVYCFVLAPPGRRDPNLSPSSSSTFGAVSPESEFHRPSYKYEQPPLPPLPPELLEDRSLTEAQCRASFPGLLKEVDDAVARGPFTLKRNRSSLGPLIARIRDGQLYILSAARKSDLSKDMLAHRSATLHQIAAALLTAPYPRSAAVPDTVFAFNHHDDPLPSTLSYSRPADPAPESTDHGEAPLPPQQQQRHYFPIPHFSFYSWPLPFVGSFARASRAITSIEESLRRPLAGEAQSQSQSQTQALPPSSSLSWWDAKIPRAVWRGTTWFNSARAGRTRQDLVAVARGKPWADVEPLRWTKTGGHQSDENKDTNNNKDNALPIEDFCRYRYVVYTEGITYSGRLPFHMLCASVVLTPPLAWLQHATHLLRPAFSYALDNNGVGGKGAGASYPADWVRSAWPRTYDPETEANVVFVAPDWSDLESTVAWLEARPRVAAAIARRQRDLFHGGGYFSPAAEMCYWRALLRGWAEVARIDDDDQGFDDLEETPWEQFSLEEIHK
ncbi:hypothetical protein F4775DRAFT_589539 [Biscogniauxia sp. FL1348]|nr:hypothetical protein F4775DRAFT_589539 [Biscogniauxia sp. FL1348]